MQSKPKLAALLASVATLFLTHSAYAKTTVKSWPPKFEQYPATNTFKGRLTFDRFGCGRKFRDQIKYAIRTQGVNFAGDSLLVEWGCGSYCQSHGIVYGPTGKVNCELPTSQVGAKFKKNSRLIILNPAEELKTVPADEAKYFTPTKYFVWNKGTLSELFPPDDSGNKVSKERKD